METDYPAAHSMDSYWFAIDSHGHVGCFETGEPGPLPVRALRNDNVEEILKELFLNEPTTVLENSRTQQAAHARELVLAARSDLTEYPNLSNVCLLLRSKEIILQLEGKMEIGAERVTPHGRVVPIFLPTLDAETYDVVHAANACLGCIDLGWLSASGPERLGIYYYDASENYQHGPYKRIGVPSHPLRFDDLEWSTRIQMTPVAMELNFEQVPNLQPLELMPCHVWGWRADGTYLASDMKTVQKLPPKAE